MNAKEIKEIRRKLGLNQTDFGKLLGVGIRSVQSWEKGTRNMSDSVKMLLNEKIMKDEQCVGVASGVSNLDTVENKMLNYKEDGYGVYLLPANAVGGSLSDFSEQIKEYECEKIISPIKSVDFAITVSGNSMYPEYPSGSRVLIKKINEKAFIDWGRVYVLDTCNGVVIKKVMPVKDDSSRILCVSINEDYPSFEVSFEDIYGVYRVLMMLSLK